MVEKKTEAEPIIDGLSEDQILVLLRTHNFNVRMDLYSKVLKEDGFKRIIKTDQGKDIPWNDAITVNQARALKRRTFLSLRLSLIDQGLSVVDYNRLVDGRFNEPPPVFDAPDVCPEGHVMLPRYAEKKKETLYYRCLPCGIVKWNRSL